MPALEKKPSRGGMKRQIIDWGKLFEKKSDKYYQNSTLTKWRAQLKNEQDAWRDTLMKKTHVSQTRTWRGQGDGRGGQDEKSTDHTMSNYIPIFKRAYAMIKVMCH